MTYASVGLWAAVACFACDPSRGTPEVTFPDDEPFVSAAADGDAPVAVSDPPTGGDTFFSTPRSGWTSPPECSRATDDTFCADCYAWPSPPRSIERNDGGERFGASFATGDFNGDGFPDVAVGAPGEDVSGVAAAGAVYVFLGTDRGFEPWRRLTGDDAGVGLAELFDFGTTLASADVNDDGLTDLAVAGAHEDPESQIVFVFQGKSDGPELIGEVRMEELDPDGHVEAAAEFGADMGLFDFDDDGKVDIAIGAPGQYVVSDGHVSGAIYVVLNDGSGFFEPGTSQRLLPSDMAGSDDGVRFGAELAVGEFAPGGAGGDVAVADPYHGGIHFYDGGWNPILAVGSATMADFGDALLAADMDADGVHELFVGGTGVPGRVEIFADITTGGGWDRLDVDTGATGSRVLPRALEWLGYASYPQLAVELDDGSGPSRVGVLDLDSSFPFAFYLGASVPRENDGGTADDELGGQVAMDDFDGDGFADFLVGAPSQPGVGSGRLYRFGADDPGLWADPSHWEDVWKDAGYEPDGSGPTYEDPMPTQVVTQQTEIAACDDCYVFSWADGTTCAEGPLRACLAGVCTDYCLSHGDGVACGDGTGSEICVASSCVTRGCGDGYRQTGALWSPRESCDDGNALAGDACSDTCVSTRLAVSSRTDGEDAPSELPPSVAEDGGGNLLFVYAADDTTGGRVLRARRYAATGAAPAGDPGPVELATGLGVGWDLEPSVAGLAGGGWVVVWTDPVADGEGAGVAMRLVFADGSLGPLRVVNEDARGSQHQPRVAPLDGGFVVVWTDASGIDGPLGRSFVEARRFGATGAPLEPEWTVSPSDRTATEPALASTGTDWLVAWTDTPDGFFTLPSVQARRFGTVTDAAPVVLSDTAGADASLAVLEGDFVAAWVRRDPDFDLLGDIQARIVFSTGDDPLIGSPIQDLAATDAPESAPSVASYEAGSFLVAYETGGRRRGVAFGGVETSVLAPEHADLAGYLVDGQQGDVTLLRTARGIWFAWSDSGPLPAAGDPDAYRSFLAYLLPLD